MQSNLLNVSYQYVQKIRVKSGISRDYCLLIIDYWTHRTYNWIIDFAKGFLHHNNRNSHSIEINNMHFSVRIIETCSQPAVPLTRQWTWYFLIENVVAGLVFLQESKMPINYKLLSKPGANSTQDELRLCFSISWSTRDFCSSWGR